MSETDISTAAVEAMAKRLRNHGHSGTHGILPVTLALLADRDRLAAEVARLTEALRSERERARYHLNEINATFEEYRAMPCSPLRDRHADTIMRVIAALPPCAGRAETLVWPDFIPPSKYANPDPRWKDPAMPDFRLIWKIARECGYAVGLHGSMRRDCDMIAAPWTNAATTASHLVDRLCAALNATVVGEVEGKPHGRLAYNLQIDGYVKVIDISVMPLCATLSAHAARREGEA